MSDPPAGSEARGSLRGRLQAVATLEVIAGAIALATPLTPSRTGSRWSPAELFTPDPSYAQKVLASFVVVNLLFVLLALAVWVAVRLQGAEGERS
jgi:hypothetical protein